MPLSHREPVLTHSCGAQYRNLNPAEISSSAGTVDPGNPLQALAKRVFKTGISLPPPCNEPLNGHERENSQRTTASVPELVPPGQERDKTEPERDHPRLCKREGDASR